MHYKYEMMCVHTFQPSAITLLKNMQCAALETGNQVIGITFSGIKICLTGAKAKTLFYSTIPNDQERIIFHYIFPPSFNYIELYIFHYINM